MRIFVAKSIWRDKLAPNHENFTPVQRFLSIPKALVWEAYKRVKANGGSAGIDDETIVQFESRLSDNLYKLWNRLCSGSYFLSGDTVN